MSKGYSFAVRCSPSAFCVAFVPLPQGTGFCFSIGGEEDDSQALEAFLSERPQLFGYGVRSHGAIALSRFLEMRSQGIKPGAAALHAFIDSANLHLAGGEARRHWHGCWVEATDMAQVLFGGGANPHPASLCSHLGTACFGDVLWKGDIREMEKDCLEEAKMCRMLAMRIRPRLAANRKLETSSAAERRMAASFSDGMLVRHWFSASRLPKPVVDVARMPFTLSANWSPPALLKLFGSPRMREWARQAMESAHFMEKDMKGMHFTSGGIAVRFSPTGLKTKTNPFWMPAGSFPGKVLLRIDIPDFRAAIMRKARIYPRGFDACFGGLLGSLFEFRENLRSKEYDPLEECIRIPANAMRDPASPFFDPGAAMALQNVSCVLAASLADALCNADSSVRLLSADEGSMLLMADEDGLRKIVSAKDSWTRHSGIETACTSISAACSDGNGNGMEAVSNQGFLTGTGWMNPNPKIREAWSHPLVAGIVAGMLWGKDPLACGVKILAENVFSGMCHPPKSGGYLFVNEDGVSRPLEKGCRWYAAEKETPGAGWIVDAKGHAVSMYLPGPFALASKEEMPGLDVERYAAAASRFRDSCTPPVQANLF